MQVAGKKDLQDLAQRALVRIRKLEAEKAQWEKQHEPLAIVGMACRVPGAENIDAFWQSQIACQVVGNNVPEDRWTKADIEALTDDPYERDCLAHGYFLNDIDTFDYGFFGLSRREAESVDPQQRLLMEQAWRAVEDAMIPMASLQEASVGVFIGIAGLDQLMLAVDAHATADPMLTTGAAHSTASGRLSYNWGFKGPAISIDTACSSSLTAVHLACDSLRRGDSDLALAGGVNVMLTPHVSLQFARAKMLSSSGRCNSFDASADGFARGEGCGMLVLQRLSDALAAGRRIYATIPGSSINQDGHSSGLTVPHGPSQQNVIRGALNVAGFSPKDVGYVEAHGTGTKLGDPIELNALAAVFGNRQECEDRLCIGSVKNSIGHLEAAAGAVGLIRAALAVYHGIIPGNPNHSRPTEAFSWTQFPFDVPRQSQQWAVGEKTRVAGVSSFGFSGSNGHILLSAFSAPVPACSIGDSSIVLCLSAKTEGDFQRLLQKWREYLADLPEDGIRAACISSLYGRDAFRYRLVLDASNGAELREELAAFSGNAVDTFKGGKRTAHVAVVLEEGDEGASAELGATSRLPAFAWADDWCREVSGAPSKAAILLLALLRLKVPVRTVYADAVFDWVRQGLETRLDPGMVPRWSACAEADVQHRGTSFDFRISIVPSKGVLVTGFDGHLHLDISWRELDEHQLLKILGMVAQAGADIDWRHFFGEMVSQPHGKLPAYPLAQDVLPRKFRHSSREQETSIAAVSQPIDDERILSTTLHELVCTRMVPDAQANNSPSRCVVWDLDERASAWTVGQGIDLRDGMLVRHHISLDTQDVSGLWQRHSSECLLIIQLSLLEREVCDASAHLMAVMAGLLACPFDDRPSTVAILIEGHSDAVATGTGPLDGVLRTLSAEFPETAIVSYSFPAGDQAAYGAALHSCFYEMPKGIGMAQEGELVLRPGLRRRDDLASLEAQELTCQNVLVIGNRSSLAVHLAKEALARGARSCLMALQPAQIPQTVLETTNLIFLLAPSLERGFFLQQDMTEVSQENRELATQLQSLLEQVKGGLAEKIILIRGCEPAFGWIGRIRDALVGDMMKVVIEGASINALTLDLPAIEDHNQNDREAEMRLASYGIQVATAAATAKLALNMIDMSGHYICLTSTDKTGEKTIDLARFSFRDITKSHAGAVAVSSFDQVEAELRAILRQVLGQPVAGQDRQIPLVELGVDSLMALEIRELLQSRLGYTFSLYGAFAGVTFLQLADDIWAHFQLQDHG